jgi:hypothetical protein
MVNAVFKFKGYIAFIMILLLSQQSFAAFFPMNCDEMNDTLIVLTENDSHMTSSIHEHIQSSKDEMSSHEKCDVCDSGDCRCTTVSLCLSSIHTITSQQLNAQHILFVDHGKRFIFTDKSPNYGTALHPFRPPISI